MSTLCMDELSLSEQAEIVGSFAAACERKYAALRSVSWSSPCPASTPELAAHRSPYLNAPGDGHTSLSQTEDASMVEKQVTNHPPLQVCHPKHVPHMYMAVGNRQTAYYVECSACMVQTARCETPDVAATEWAHRQVIPIVGTADHATVAA